MSKTSTSLFASVTKIQVYCLISQIAIFAVTLTSLAAAAPRFPFIDDVTDLVGMADTTRMFNFLAQPMPLGNYPNKTVTLGGNTTVTPDVAPTGTTSISVSTSTNFKGTFYANPATGVVGVMNAHSAGSYTVTVTAFNGSVIASTKTFTLTVQPGTACTGDSFFVNAADLTVGTIPGSTAIGDFNRDGIQDVAIPTRQGIAIRLGTGTGGFTDKPYVGFSSDSVAIGDFDGDGNQDLAYANGLFNVAIRLGDGTGAFPTVKPDVIAGQILPNPVLIGDFNNDGKQDLAIVNSSSGVFVGGINVGSVSIRLGVGDGTFTGTTEVILGNTPKSAAVGDFNNDGKQDLVVVNGGESTISMLTGAGNGTFSVTTSGWGFGTRSVAIGDFNNDGNQDLAIGSFSTVVGIRLGNGSGGFSDITTVDMATSGVTVGDFNNDGNQDIVASAFDDGKISFVLGDGTGGFSGRTSISVGSGPRSISIGDFNGDGKQDLAISNENTNTVSIRLGVCVIDPSVGAYPNTTVKFSSNTTITPLTAANGISGMNINAGQYFEGTFAADPATGIVRVINARPAGTFPVTVTGFNLAGAKTTRTFNLVVEPETACAGVTGYTNVAFVDAVGGTHAVAVGDFNKDGKQDLAVTNDGTPESTPGNISIHLGLGTGAFTRITPDVPVDNGPRFVAVGDFNNDGKQDLAVANFTQTVSIRLGDGAGGFSGSTEVMVGINPVSVQVLDYNGDANQDIVVRYYSGNTNTVRFGDGKGGFGSSGLDGNLGFAAPSTSAFGDFNGDGRQDIAAPTSQPNVSIRLGTCNSTPTIAVTTGLSRVQSSSAINSTIANVTDDGGNNNVTFTIASANPSNGVTISNIANTDGTITANIGADCTATNVTFTLQASDGASTSTTLLTVAVTANPGPTLAYTNQSVLFQGSASINPSTSPTDNGSVSSIVVQSKGAYTGTIGVNNTTGVVSISDAKPVGTHAIKIRATDNCGAITDSTFDLVVPAPPLATLGAYPNTDVVVNTNATVIPDAAPTNAVSVSASSSPGFQGTLSADMATGKVFVTNAQPVGTYTVTVSALNSNDVATNRTFTLTVTSISPRLGTYQNTSVSLGGSTAIIPDAVPIFTTSINVSSSTNFKGTLSANTTTGTVSITNAHPAGTHVVTVKAFKNNDEATTKTFTLTVQSGSSCTGVSKFSTSAENGVGSAPTSVAIGDFNNDGKQDFAAVNADAKIAIRIGNGTGGFDPMADVQVESGSTSIAVADFNNDGNQDLAVTSFADKVSIRFGNGTGAFSGTTALQMVDNPRSLAVGDFNGDGRQDIAVTLSTVTASSPARVSIRLGDGLGGFTVKPDVSVFNPPTTVAVGDFNGDGKQDLAVASNPRLDGLESYVSIRLGDGAGNFSGNTEVTTGYATMGIAVGDFNGDGKQDFAATNSSGFANTDRANSVSIRLGNGAGGFSGTLNVGVVDRPEAVAIGDFNNDGKQDFAATNLNSGKVSIRLGNGGGGFSGTDESFGFGGVSKSVAIGDFNGDSRQDLAIVNSGANRVFVLLGRCDGAPAVSPASGVSRQKGSSASNSTIATVTDDGGNGNVTVAVTSANPSNGVTISNIVNTGGTITADIAADCTATNASFTLEANDGSATTTTTLTVGVTANTPPTMTYGNQSVAFKDAVSINPASGPSDNGNVSSIAVQSTGTYTGSISVDNTTGIVSLSNAGPVGTHTIKIRVTDNCGDFTDANLAVTVGRGSQTISVGTHSPVNASYNSGFTVAAASTSGLAVSYGSAGACTNSGATFTITSGTGTCTVKYDQAGDSNYSAAPQVTETVNAQKIAQTITVGTHAPASATENTGFTVAATSTSALAVSYSSAGACTNTGALFTAASGTGTCTVKYDQAGDNNYNAAAQLTETVTVRANQTITVGTHAPANGVYNSTFTVVATSTSGLTVSYSSAGACTNTGAVFTMTASTGTCTVMYDQAGNTSYVAATQVTESVTAQKADQSITVGTHAPTNANFNSSFTVEATSDSRGTVSYGSSGSCSNVAGIVTMTSGVGICTVKYDQAGNSNYNPAPQVTESVGAQRANQTITVGTHAPASAGYAGTFTVVAAASSGLPITYGSTGACSNFTATGVYTMTASTGTCTVTYDQPGDDNYNAGSQMSESVEARKGSQTITIDTHAPASAVYNTSFDVVGLASSGLIVTYSVTGDCTNFLFNIHMTAGTGSCTVKYDQAGNGNYDAAPQVTETVTAAKASQTITVDTHAPSTAAYNTSFMVSSHGSSIAPVIYSSSGVCSNSGATFTMTSGTGTCTVTYDQVGDSNYNPAPQLTESVTAGKANQTITVSTHAPSSAAYNSSFTVAATSTSSVDVTYSSSGVCTNISAAFTMISGPGPCTVKYDQAGDGNHNAAAQVTETVLRLNDAPSLDNSGSMGLSAINEDVPDATNPGTLVSGIIASAGGDRITDIDDGALEGIAVIAVDNANGVWQFSIDDGSKWTPFGSPDPLNARQLAANAVTKIRFVPSANFNGTVDPGLTFRAWDQTSGTNGNTGDATIFGGTSAFSSATETASITVNAVNDSPSITAAAPLTRQQGTAPSNSSVALVSDIDTPAGGLTVTATTVPAGITIANIVNTSGTITANIAAECGAATGNNSVVLQVSDGSLTATASLTVTVTANKLPVLTYGTASVINLGSTTINPATGPTDNGSIANVIVQSAGTYTGTISVNNSGVVSISNAGPVGSHTITVRATDNCGAAADAAFTLNVTNHTPSIIAAAAVTRQRGSAGTISPIATVSDPDQSPGSLVVTATTLPSGITFTGITNTAGAVTANTAADCSAALGSNTVVLTVTDSTGGTATANFTFNVAANSAPTVTYAGPQGVAFGGSLNVTPTAAADNGSITGYSVLNVVPALTTPPTVNSSGVVSVTNAQPGGAHTVTIRATDNCGVTTDTQFTLNVGTAATTTSVASSQNPSLFGQSVTFTATIATALGTPTGSVTFNIDGNPACINVPMTPPAACMLTTLATGNHSVTVTYNGDSNFNASSGSLLGGQTVSKTATSTAITNSLAAGTNSGQSYAVNWTVTANPPGDGTPSGSVTVSDGTDNCTAAAAAGTCSLTSTTSGFKTITAVYSGDSNFNTSTSAGVAHTVMTAISGHIGQSGSTPEAAGLQGVMITLTGTPVPPGTTTTTDANGNYSFAVLPNGGNYTVTPSGAGVTFDPLSQNFTGLTTNVPNANFMAYTGSVPRELRIVNTYVMPGQAVIVPVMLNGLGNENTGQFSLNYDVNHLSVPTVTCGSSDPGCLLELDTSLPGKLGIKITPATQLVAGVRNIANVTFQTFANEPSNTSITFGGSPTAELVSDAGANPLSATYSNAMVIFGRGVEGDVAGRPDGSGSVNTSDITGIARFVAGTDTPGVQNTNEYQRADCAPAGTGGNGQLNASDIVQASRYSAGLDGGNQIAASGPFEQPNVSSPVIKPERSDDESDQAKQKRTMRVVSTMASAGGDVAVLVEMDSLGDEVASSFSLTFDPKKLKISDVSSPDTNADVSIGSDAPTGTGITVNAANAERGQIGIVVFNSGLVPFSRGPVAKRVVTLTFHVAKDAPSGPTPVTFTAAEDGPTTRSLSDGNAKELKATYTDGEVNIIGSRAAGLSIPRRAVTTDQSNVNAATLGLIDTRELQKRPRPRSDDEAFYNSEKRGVKR